MATQIEKKTVIGLECKLAVEAVETDTDTMTFSGYGSVFGNVDSYGDIIEKGAFKASIERHLDAGTMPMMFLNHRIYDSLPIGSWTAVEEDDYGLKVTGELLDTSDGLDTYKALKKGLIKGLSIGFYPVVWEMASKSDEYRRTITEVDLVEVSVVNMPANGSALIADVKSNIEEMRIRDLERLLRDRGLSRKEAETVASQFESKRYLAEREQKRVEMAELNARLSRLLGK